jgi:hypothetical protein
LTLRHPRKILRQTQMISLRPSIKWGLRGSVRCVQRSKCIIIPDSDVVRVLSLE